MSSTVSRQEKTTITPLAGYAPIAGVYDEVLDAGNIRHAWQPFVAGLARIGSAELLRRWEQSERLVYENGLSYKMHGDAEGTSRPWDLDALPLLIDETQWQSLSRALIQRAKLLNAVLADLYGPRKLVRDGHLPPQFLFSHPGYMRSFRGVRVPDNCYLHLYAVDLARSPDGQWQVVCDRTDAPIGIGYALENRVVISRMLPHLIRDCQVQRLASFFRTFRAALHELAARHRENPRIVLLSEGPKGISYFEDAYLARYLGYTLVEHDDLTVREDRVFLKTLGGLTQVDVILRRVAERHCDPLELPGGAAHGVPGLTQAIRCGNVAVANALGSGLVEAPALMPFLPQLCRQLLGEEPLIGSVATWWCNSVDACDDVLSRIDHLAIVPAYLSRDQAAAKTSLARRPAEELQRLIVSQPTNFVGQERVNRSSVPVWNATGVKPYRMALRAFLVACDHSYEVMPGGLVRVGPTSDEFDFSILAGQGSKDAWVLSGKPVPYSSLFSSRDSHLQLRRTGADLPSRVADHLFWLGRHTERAEITARLMRTALLRLTSETEIEAILELPALLRTMATMGHIEPGVAVDGMRQQLPAIDELLPRAAFDATTPASLLGSIQSSYRSAMLVRDRISIDSWRVINRMHRQFQLCADRGNIDLSALLELLNSAITDIAALDGLVSESMTRAQGWRFLDLGRRLERSLHTITLITTALLEAAQADALTLEAVLEVADSLITSRSRYLTSLELAPTLDLLLTDETNPRSVAYQLVRITQHIEQLPRDKSQPLRSAEQRLAMSMLSNVRMVDLDLLCEAADAGQSSKLHGLLIRFLDQLPKLSELVTNQYLIHADTQRSLSGTVS